MCILGDGLINRNQGRYDCSWQGPEKEGERVRERERERERAREREGERENLRTAEETNFLPECKLLNDFILHPSTMNSSSYVRFGKSFPVVSPVSLFVFSKSKDIDLGKQTYSILSISCYVNYILNVASVI